MGAGRLQEKAATGPDAGSSGHGKLWKAFKTTGSQIERDKGENCLTRLLIFWLNFSHRKYLKANPMALEVRVTPQMSYPKIIYNSA